MSVDDYNRVYRARLVFWFAMPFASLVVVAAVVLLVLHHAAIPLLLFGVVCMCGFIAFAARLYRGGSARETSIEFRDRWQFGWRSWRWEEIERFEARHRRIWIVLSNGTRAQLVGTAQSATYGWNNGTTKDMTGVLNERLANWRRLTRHAPPAAAKPADPRMQSDHLTTRSTGCAE